MNVTIFEHANDLPSLSSNNYFHSHELMELCEQTPRQKPYMVVVTDDTGHVCAHLLAVERSRRSWLPPYLYKQVRVLGEGVYAEEADQQMFGLMVNALTERLQHKSLFIEFSNLSHKMFGYRQLRAAGFFPVKWMSVHNSLHSLPPEERISERQLRRINNAKQRGLTTQVAATEEEFREFSELLRHHNWLKPRRYIPHNQFFRGMMKAGRCEILLSKIHGMTIGTTVVVFSDKDAYLWYSASRRKTFAALHPNAVTFWETICRAHQNGRQHIRFMDVGLPFRRNPYRDFILSFGGKEVSTFRWFRISIRWVNALASWLWRE